MKTLCYKIALSYGQQLYNEGFIIVEIKDNAEIKKMEGLLTDDYLGCNIKGNKVELTIYTKNCKGNLTKFIYIEMDVEDFELPLDIKLMDEVEKITLKTKKRITTDIERRKEMIREFKENNVFEKERS